MREQLPRKSPCGLSRRDLLRMAGLSVAAVCGAAACADVRDEQADERIIAAHQAVFAAMS